MTLREYLEKELADGHMVRAPDIPNNDDEWDASYFDEETQIGCVIGLACEYLRMHPPTVEDALESAGGELLAIQANDAGDFKHAIDLVCKAWPS